MKLCTCSIYLGIFLALKSTVQQMFCTATGCLILTCYSRNCASLRASLPSSYVIRRHTLRGGRVTMEQMEKNDIKPNLNVVEELDGIEPSPHSSEPDFEFDKEKF